jgi:hypothetical protein
MSTCEFEKLVDVPVSSGPLPSHSATDITKMSQEGGAGLINFLLSAAVSSAPGKGKIPKVSKVCEWHFRDLMHLPKAMQEK